MVKSIIIRYAVGYIKNKKTLLTLEIKPRFGDGLWVCENGLEKNYHYEPHSFIFKYFAKRHFNKLISRFGLVKVDNLIDIDDFKKNLTKG